MGKYKSYANLIYSKKQFLYSVRYGLAVLRSFFSAQIAALFDGNKSAGWWYIRNI